MYSTKPMTESYSNCTSVMLRNHYIVAVHVEPILQILIGLYYALLIIVESMLFAVLLGIHIKIRKYCHPFFGSLFGYILFCYILCDLAEGICQFLFIFNAGSSALEVVYMIYDLTYAAVTPLAFCCVIERSIATLWAVSYETNRNWALFTISVAFSVSAYIYFGSFQCRGCFASAAVTAIIIIGCVALYFLNRKRTLRYQTDEELMGKTSLSMRYQIIENLIMVRKALLPVIVLDSMVTLVDFLSNEITDRMLRDNYDQCHSLMVFAPYIVLNHFALLFEYSIPLYILMTRKAYRKHLPAPLRFLSSSRRIHQKSHDSIIQNVFGKELNVVPTQNEYFAKLQNEWKK